MERLKKTELVFSIAASVVTVGGAIIGAIIWYSERDKGSTSVPQKQAESSPAPTAQPTPPPPTQPDKQPTPEEEASRTKLHRFYMILIVASAAFCLLVLPYSQWHDWDMRSMGEVLEYVLGFGGLAICLTGGGVLIYEGVKWFQSGLAETTSHYLIVLLLFCIYLWVLVSALKYINTMPPSWLYRNGG